MLRLRGRAPSGPLSDGAVIQWITANCVPVALDRHTIAGDKGETGSIFRSIYQQEPQYQGLWLVAPDGRVLGATGRVPGDVASWPQEALADLRTGMKKFGTIEPHRVTRVDSLPFRGKGVRPDGSVTLAVSDRRINVKNLSQEVPPDAVGELLLGSVTLSAAEWSTFAPRNASVGSRWDIPEAVGGDFFPMLAVEMWEFEKRSEVTEFELAGRVASVQDGIACLVYRGHVAGDHDVTWDGGTKRSIKSTALKLTGGVGTYDIRAGQMLSLAWVWDGVYFGYEKPSDRDRAPRFRYAVVVEWRRADPISAAHLKTDAPGLEAKIGPADSTPEDALKTFLLALAAQDEAALRAVTLPHPEFDLLLRGPAEPPAQLALLKARLEEKPMRRLKTGDPVRMPDGESRVIKPADVREGRVVLWADGESLPSRLENVNGHWKVFAAPFIAARK